MATASGALSADPEVFLRWSWADFEPYVQDLLDRELTAETVESFLSDWSALIERIAEMFNRLLIATVRDTTDEQSEAAYHRFLDEVFPQAQQADQSIKEKLLASGLSPAGFEVPLRKAAAEAELFRETNVPLFSEERKLGERYAKIAGAQTVTWEGKEIPVAQLAPILQEPDRAIREEAWRAGSERQLADRGDLNALWQEMLALRRQLAANAGLPDYREFRWRQLLRFSYGPEDCIRFDEAIAEVVVPVATRINARRRTRLGVPTLRPWDFSVDPLGRPALQPYQDVTQLVKGIESVFIDVDPALGRYFATMAGEGLLDLESRQNKGPGGFCADLPVSRRPYIFMNAVGVHDDVQTLLHEGGHAFHTFESLSLPWAQQRDVGMEFAEVASMSMELLAAPYLAAKPNGFYDRAEAARARLEHLEGIVLFWPYMAVVDRFQQWAYTHPDEAADPDRCDSTWTGLYRRYRPDEDWTGLEDALKTGWQRKVHIFDDPFYYVEYGLAQLGSVQIWANARRDQRAAVTRYRQALALGGTRPVPELYDAAGARFAFDAGTLQSAMELLERVIAELERDSEPAHQG